MMSLKYQSLARFWRHTKNVRNVDIMRKLELTNTCTVKVMHVSHISATLNVHYDERTAFSNFYHC